MQPEKQSIVVVRGTAFSAHGKFKREKPVKSWRLRRDAVIFRGSGSAECFKSKALKIVILGETLLNKTDRWLIGDARRQSRSECFEKKRSGTRCVVK